MAFSEYVGRSPSDATEGRRIDRVTAHHVWDVRSEATGTCANCDAGLRLQDRHVLVRLVGRSADGGLGRRYLCDEGCLHEWVTGDRRSPRAGNERAPADGRTDGTATE